MLALPLSTALSLAEPTDRVYFNLSHATDQGDQETTTGWISIQGPILHLTISAVHDRHGPGPDISKYDRQLPNIPEASASYDVTFEPEELSGQGEFVAPFLGAGSAGRVADSISGGACRVDRSAR